MGYLEAQQIDQAVDQEVRRTIQEIQDEAAQTLKQEASSSGVDLAVALETAASRMRGSLTVADAARALSDQLRRSRVPLPELEVLVKRYQQGSIVEHQRLARDLGGRPQGVREERKEPRMDDKRRLSQKDQQQLDALIQKVAAQCEKKGSLPRLARELAAHERGVSLGSINERTFFSELANAGVVLTAAEEDLLASGFPERGGQRGLVDYRTFLEELGRVKPSAGPSRPKVALSKGQEDLIRSVKQWLSKPGHQGKAAQLMGEFKKRDPQSRGYLLPDRVQESLGAVGLSLGSSQTSTLCQCTQPNAQGLFSYKEILELVVPPEEVAQMFTATRQQLEGDAWRQGAGGAPAAEFKVPTQPTGPLSSMMASIGWLFIGTGKNYEAILVQEASPDAAPGRPAISSDRLGRALGKLNIRLPTAEQRELDRFFRDRENDRLQVEITALLEAFGLPA